MKDTPARNFNSLLDESQDYKQQMFYGIKDRLQMQTAAMLLVSFVALSSVAAFVAVPVYINRNALANYLLTLLA